MGYMGFGMKKEVFTRKPKEAFKKLKSIYGHDTVRAKDFKIEKVNPQTIKKLKEKLAAQREASVMRAIFILTVSSMLGIVLTIYWSDLIKWWFMQ